ncbi:MAG TPA: DHH family phosphoesterase [Patescibacteria group bacterium]|jgi:phosphoesterase RecJ-like protein|nr:DHH family phosphoesterase [Patescibacteria group bacterium]
MFETAKQRIEAAKHIIIIQAENPDGDSIGSSLALEEILSDLGKDVTMYCPVDVPKYLRYFSGWDRIVNEFDTRSDLAIIVDTSADVLLGKVLESRGVRHYLETHPVLVLDHHATDSTLSFEHDMVNMPVVATGELIYNLAAACGWSINSLAAEDMLAAMMSDSLGLTTPGTTANSFFVAGKLTELGASNAAIEERRREFMKKSPEILAYKGKLIERVEYMLDGKLALVHVPFEEIEQYSDQYNPGALIGDELRLVQGVEVSCVIKTYPDGKLTARLRSRLPVSETISGYFGGGGHAHAAGFRVYESYDTVIHELVEATDKAIASHEASA